MGKKKRIFDVKPALMAVFLPLLVAAGAFAQTQQPAAREAQQVELAVPFGAVPGQLVTSGKNVIFIDGRQLRGSFAFDRGDVRNSRVEKGGLTIELAEPVQTSGGEMSTLHLRFADPSAAQGVSTWLRMAPIRTDNEPGTPASQPGTMTFHVKHDHFVGSDTGRLMVTPSELIYESVTEVDSSRRWSFSDIKEVKQDGPYKLKVVPFSGDQYNFELLGQTMSSDQFRTLVNRVTNARVRTR